MTCIGVFDSGVGGLSVWREIDKALPGADTIYVADGAHIPYGPRPLAEIRGFSTGISRFLVERGCTTIVVACNTASAAALSALRAAMPATVFVGMEPAVKPAAAATRHGVVGVLATQATFQGELFATTVERFAADVRLVRQVCPGLVERIEAGDVDGPETQSLLRAYLQPCLDAGADTIVLACTHYAFVRPSIESIAGSSVEVIDPAAAIARQVARTSGAAIPATGGHASFFTTGDHDDFERVAQRLLGRHIRAHRLVWDREGLCALDP
jgi:glutamate racemase